MEKFVWVMLKILHMQHEKTHQREDQDHSAIKHGLFVAEILAARAYSTLLASDRSIGACCLNAFVKLRNGIQIILVISWIGALTINSTTGTNTNCCN